MQNITKLIIELREHMDETGKYILEDLIVELLKELKELQIKHK